MNAPPTSPIDRILHDLQERAKELELPLPRRRAPAGPRAPARRRPRRRDARSLPAGSSRTCARRGSSSATGCSSLRASAESPWSQSAVIGAEARRPAASTSTTRRRCRRRTRARSSTRSGSCSTPSPSASGLRLASSGRRGPRRDRGGRDRGGGWCSTSCARPTALFRRLGRKMINHLCWNGVEEAGSSCCASRAAAAARSVDDNRPLRARVGGRPDTRPSPDFRIAAAHLPEDEILAASRAGSRRTSPTS